VEDAETDAVTGPKPVPDDLLHTDSTSGLTDNEVATRRKRFGPNVLSKFRPPRRLAKQQQKIKIR